MKSSYFFIFGWLNKGKLRWLRYFDCVVIFFIADIYACMHAFKPNSFWRQSIIIANNKLIQTQCSNNHNNFYTFFYHFLLSDLTCCLIPEVFTALIHTTILPPPYNRISNRQFDSSWLARYDHIKHISSLTCMNQDIYFNNFSAFLYRNHQNTHFFFYTNTRSQPHFTPGALASCIFAWLLLAYWPLYDHLLFWFGYCIPKKHFQPPSSTTKKISHKKSLIYNQQSRTNWFDAFILALVLFYY